LGTDVHETAADGTPGPGERAPAVERVRPGEAAAGQLDADPGGHGHPTVGGHRSTGHGDGTGPAEHTAVTPEVAVALKGERAHGELEGAGVVEYRPGQGEVDAVGERERTEVADRTGAGELGAGRHLRRAQVEQCAAAADLHSATARPGGGAADDEGRGRQGP